MARSEDDCFSSPNADTATPDARELLDLRGTAGDRCYVPSLELLSQFGTVRPQHGHTAEVTQFCGEV